MTTNFVEKMLYMQGTKARQMKTDLKIAAIIGQHLVEGTYATRCNSNVVKDYFRALINIVTHNTTVPYLLFWSVFVSLGRSTQCHRINANDMFQCNCVCVCQ